MEYISGEPPKRETLREGNKKTVFNIMPEEVEFEEWWNDYIHSPANIRDDWQDSVERLIRTVKAFPKEKREAFITELFNHDLDKVASRLIPDYGNEEHKLKIRE